MVEVGGVELLTEFDDSIRIFRTDRLTTKCCGNKQFKLTNNLLDLKQRGATCVLSFGGLWSNHLHAFAVACKAHGLAAVALVRGDPLQGAVLLDDAIVHGLTVRYVSRAEYRLRHHAGYVSQKMQDLNCDAWLPEGGSNALAVKSCEKIAHLLNDVAGQPPLNIALGVGTGATMAGIVNGASADQKVIGIPVVQDDRLRLSIQAWVTRACADWQLLEPAPPQRYGKVDSSLLEFVLEAFHYSGVILDPVYNAKALRSLLRFRRENSDDDDCVFVHTGGLGGCLGYSDRLLAIDAGIGTRLLSEVSRLLDLPE